MRGRPWLLVEGVGLVGGFGGGDVMGWEKLCRERELGLSLEVWGIARVSGLKLGEKRWQQEELSKQKMGQRCSHVLFDPIHALAWA